MLSYLVEVYLFGLSYLKICKPPPPMFSRDISKFFRTAILKNTREQLLLCYLVQLITQFSNNSIKFYQIKVVRCIKKSWLALNKICKKFFDVSISFKKKKQTFWNSKFLNFLIIYVKLPWFCWLNKKQLQQRVTSEFRNE